MKNEHYIMVDGKRISYTLCKTRRKTIGITIDMRGEVKVSAPLRVSEKQICEAVQKKAGWIAGKVNEALEMSSKAVIREFVSGESLQYLGEEYTLEVLEKDLGKAEVQKNDDVISVYITRGLSGESRKQAIKEALIKWYRQRFSEIVSQRMEKYSLQVKATPCKVVVKDQKTLWGSCSQRGNINLNWRLVMAPLPVIDYVIVHELCHLNVMNHSKSYWNLVESIIPDYREMRGWLKKNGNRLTIC